MSGAPTDTMCGSIVFCLLVDAMGQIGALSQLPGLVVRRLQGPLIKFALDREANWSGWDAERLLLEYGVRVCGRGFDQDNLYFYVPAHQANWAEYVLCRYGAPLVTVHNVRNLGAQGRGAIPSWGRPLRSRDPGGWLCEALDWLAGKRREREGQDDGALLRQADRRVGLVRTLLGWLTGKDGE